MDKMALEFTEPLPEIEPAVSEIGPIWGRLQWGTCTIGSTVSALGPLGERGMLNGH